MEELRHRIRYSKVIIHATIYSLSILNWIAILGYLNLNDLLALLRVCKKTKNAVIRYVRIFDSYHPLIIRYYDPTPVYDVYRMLLEPAILVFRDYRHVLMRISEVCQIIESGNVEPIIGCKKIIIRNILHLASGDVSGEDPTLERYLFGNPDVIMLYYYAFIFNSGEFWKLVDRFGFSRYFNPMMFSQYLLINPAPDSGNEHLNPSQYIGEYEIIRHLIDFLTGGPINQYNISVYEQILTRYSLRSYLA